MDPLPASKKSWRASAPETFSSDGPATGAVTDTRLGRHQERAGEKPLKAGPFKRARTRKAVSETRGFFQRLAKSPVAQYPFVIGEAIAPLAVDGVSGVSGVSGAGGDRRLRLEQLQNQREACARINGTVLKSGEIFNFKSQVGRTWRIRGFFGGAALRSLAEMATVLCRAAESAGLMIIEKNLSLRFAAPEVVSGAEAVLIETSMTPYELIVRVRSKKPQMKTLGFTPLQHMKRASYDQIAVGGAVNQAAHDTDPHMKTAALLDRYVPEFEEYLAGELIDLLFVPYTSHRYRWNVPSISRRKTATFQAFKRAIYSRWGAGKERVGAETRLKTAEWIALEYARKLPFDVEHLIIAQDFLPYLWRAGVLQGRSFDVLLTRPPLSFINQKLDVAHRQLPEFQALTEYRTPRDLVRAESEALVFAERVITPHAEYAKLYPNLRKLEWIESNLEPTADVRRPRYLLLPASLRARDGAKAVLLAARELGIKLLVVGGDPEGLSEGSDDVLFLTRQEVPWHEVAAVIHPTLFESWPRLHLQALALAIPVIATEACGIAEGEGVTIVPFADDAAVLRAAAKAVNGQQSAGPVNGPRPRQPSPSTGPVDRDH